MPNSPSPSKQGVELAARFRAKHKLGVGPVDDINDLMKLVEADFIVLDLAEDLDALTLRDPGSDALTVGIGTSNNPFRQRLTIAHEIGHIVAGDITEDGASLQCDKTLPNEVRATTFARCVLCPEEALREMPQYEDPEQLLSAVVQRFQVSPYVAAIQLHQAGLMSKDTKEELKNHTAKKLASRFGWKATYDHACKVAQLPRASERLVADAYKAYALGLIALPTVAFAEQVSPEEVADSMYAAPGSVGKNLTGQRDIEADLEDFFANE